MPKLNIQKKQVFRFKKKKMFRRLQSMVISPPIRPFHGYLHYDEGHEDKE
jgi:hypothetical protein